MIILTGMESRDMSKNHIAENMPKNVRPKRFSDVVGQKVTTSILQRALKSNKVPQQVLFSGGSGLGKTTIGRILASSLLCENSAKTGEPCFTCNNCNLSTNSIHPDIIEFDAASYGGKEEIKEIASKATFMPVMARYKVYIIDEAHGLSNAGGQAFLKLLEEPPPHVYFILCTTDPERMLTTNRGRCTEFTLSRPSEESLIEMILILFEKYGYNASRETAIEICKISDKRFGIRGIVNLCNKIMISAMTIDITPVDLRKITMYPSSELVRDLIFGEKRLELLEHIENEYNLENFTSQIYNECKSYYEKNTSKDNLPLLELSYRGVEKGYSYNLILYQLWEILDR